MLDALNQSADPKAAFAILIDRTASVAFVSDHKVRAVPSIMVAIVSSHRQGAVCPFQQGRDICGGGNADRLELRRSIGRCVQAFAKRAKPHTSVSIFEDGGDIVDGQAVARADGADLL